MNAVPDVHLHFIRKDGVFVLKDDYVSRIHSALVNYFQINNQEKSKNMVQMINDQAQILLMAINSSTCNDERYCDNEKVCPSSSVISEWNDEEQRNVTLLSVTLTYTYTHPLP